MEAFTQGTIDNLAELFGRTTLITKLRKYAERQDNVNLVGARRTGKTCVLKTLQTTLKTDPGSKIYPFYVDIRDAEIKGNTRDVYRYIIATVIANLNQDGIWYGEELTLSGVTFRCQDLVEDVFEDEILCAQSSAKTQSIFNNLVKKINIELGKTVLILFDEYEKLMKYAFDEPSGFYRMRNMVNDRSLSFAFIVAGHEKWDKVISKLGSGELNVVNVEECVPPLTAAEFHELWVSECRKIDNADLRSYVVSMEDFAFEKSGGIPFFGKNIGAYLIVNRQKPTHLNISLEETLASLDQDERLLLQQLDKGEFVHITPPLESLIVKGLVIRDGDSYKITMGFLKDIIRSKEYMADLRKAAEPPCEKLAKEAFTLIEIINSTRSNKGHDYPFELVYDSNSIEEDLRTPCSTRAEFEDFCSALYRNHFERSKENGYTRGRLPVKNRKTEFTQIVGIFRHSFGAHERDTFDADPNIISYAEALRRIHGSDNEPYSAEDFIKMQEKMLELYVVELNDLLKKAREDQW